MLVQNKSANKKGWSSASTTTSCIIYQLLNKNFASNISQVQKKEASLKYISANRVEPAFQPVKYARNTNTNTKANTFVFICISVQEGWSLAFQAVKYAPKIQVCAQDAAKAARSRFPLSQL